MFVNTISYKPFGEILPSVCGSWDKDELIWFRV